MNIDILTLFPNSFDFLRSYGVIGKAVENNLINISTVDIRSFSKDKHKKVDDEVYGGSAGMLMKVEPVIDAIESVKKENSKVIFLSPQGRVFNQEIANELSKEEHIILLCGHYEGIDSRVVNNYVDFELSIGDYVLTGGEIPAMVVIDATARLVANVIGKEESYQTDSHYNILLQHDHFTRPREYRGMKVPEVLFSGNHKLIKEWQKNSSIENTKRKRPDLYKKYIESLRKG
ncbi:tRNA (guanosine(37)-N1)-methyltransferase TrmD [Helcococcus kunzii]|uniref:tRNA (guanosine(37)-N1)-methyltransferase TrmD n=1 Tax=Helcococcus kunzii TaxID=40091 RepID=UPI0024AE1256|nr:tRNA (guanosine(37)-N1)-methyltransferase TrmD [Helcococcus kunzii]